MQPPDTVVSPSCPTDADLEAFDRGYLPGVGIDRVSAHLETGCPRCTTALARLGSTADDFASALRGNRTARVNAAPEMIASRYQVVAELGRGGMGVVYRARDLQLNRDVAIKMILCANKTSVARFMVEAGAMATVNHPNVVQVHERGEHDGHPFLAMEFVAGESLQKRMERESFTPRQAAELVAEIATGVQAAHDAGIVHRDLKPANILLNTKRREGDSDSTQQGTAAHPQLDSVVPKVTDFGVARHGVSDLTATEAIVGTPDYMAPEQAAGRAKFVGPAADVYALGVILYELLTRVVPFKGADVWSVIRQVVNDPPVRPRKLVPSVPRDLETICLMCLEKEPSQRYPSAAELADDLRRFLRGEPCNARPAGPIVRAAKWVRRNRVVAGALAAVFLALLVGTGVSFGFGLEAKREAGKARTSAADAIEKGNELKQVNGVLEGTIGELARKKHEVEQKNDENVRQVARGLVAAADERVNAGNPVAALPFLADGLAKLAEQRTGDKNLERVLRIKIATITALTPKPVRVWVEPDAVVHAEFASDGKRILTLCRDGTARVCDAATGAVVGKVLSAPTTITRAALSPDGVRVVTGERNGRVLIWDVATGSAVAPPLALGAPVLHVAFSPDGKLVLAAGGELYAATVYRKVGAAVVPDSPQAFVKVWEVPAEPKGAYKQTAVFAAAGWINHAAFAPSGKEIAIASACDAATGDPLVQLGRLDGPKQQPVALEHETDVLRVAYSPDGKRVVAACGGIDVERADAVVWDVVTKKRVGQPLAHEKSVTLANFNNDGSLIVTGSDDGTARIWNATTTQPVSPPLVHQDRITAAEFSPDGRLVLTAGRDGMVRLWHGTALKGKAGEPALPPLPHGNPVLSAGFSRDGTRIFTTCENGVVRIWDIATAVARVPTYPHAGTVTYASALSDTALVTVTGDTEPVTFAGGGMGAAMVPVKNKQIHIWDRKNQEKPRHSTDHTGSAGPWLVSPKADRASVATGGSPFNPRWNFGFWSFANGDRRDLGAIGQQALWAGFTPTGTHLVVTSSAEGPKERPRYAVSVTNGDTGKPIGGALHHDAPLHRAVVSADGATLVTVCGPGAVLAPAPGRDATVRLWDIESGKPRGEYQIPHQLIGRVFISPKGNYLAIVHPAAVKIHRAGGGAPPVELLARDVLHVAFSADERLVATASADQTARLWVVTTGQAQGAALDHRGQVTFAAFSSCGRYVATTSHDKTARVWDARTGQPLTPWLLHRGPVVHASFAPDGVRLVTASADGTARVWEVLAEENRSVAELGRIAEVLTGRRPEAAGGSPAATPASYLEAWKQLNAAWPKEYGAR